MVSSARHTYLPYLYVASQVAKRYPVVQLFTSWSADRFNERGLHSAAMATIGAVGFLISAALPPDAYLSRYGGLIRLGGTPGQIVGVFIYKSNEAKRGYPTGHWTNAALLFAVGVCAVVLRIYYAWRNRKILRERVDGEEVRLFKY